MRDGELGECRALGEESDFPFSPFGGRNPRLFPPPHSFLTRPSPPQSGRKEIIPIQDSIFADAKSRHYQALTPLKTRDFVQLLCFNRNVRLTCSGRRGRGRAAGRRAVEVEERRGVVLVQRRGVLLLLLLLVVRVLLEVVGLLVMLLLLLLLVVVEVTRGGKIVRTT